MTTSTKLREEGNAIYKKVNHDLAPVLQLARLKDALNFYNRALQEADCNLDKSSACKNVLIASSSILR